MSAIENVIIYDLRNSICYRELLTFILLYFSIIHTAYPH